MKLLSTSALPALALAASTLLVSACNATPAAPAAKAANATVDAVPARATLPVVKVHKDPNCGCCGGWAEHMQAAGFPVEVHDTSDMALVKQRLGIGEGMMSCHTSEIDGYVVEGHVPVSAIQKLLAERPKARGLVLPGMPIGSPGMESPDGYRQPFTVALLAEDGSLSEFSRHE
ncbi:DUF411 domain-containing protein [Stenotrophomonas sp. MH1]|uniref:DUF411 domain-containing protein n=1 Tax=Stenotrophomonas capsici TaxID=3110230 RepID=A0ABU5V3R5_9GAMM|nr:DUF411 domain-containing protein [Stenotrophomonas sp. MH1]MEA5667827.1 DUF411 domain-containing protein [Stenotrophomonas sp. MH1]